jgi:hypothetical protein
MILVLTGLGLAVPRPMPRLGREDKVSGGLLSFSPAAAPPWHVRFDRSAAAAHAATLAAAWDAEGGAGGTILLLGRDGPTHAACGGLADLAHGIRITSDTAFRGASITKQVLAALVLRAGPGLGGEARRAPARPLAGRRVGDDRACARHDLGPAGCHGGRWQTHVPPSAAMSRAMLLGFVASAAGA